MSRKSEVIAVDELCKALTQHFCSAGYFSNIILLSMSNGTKPALPPHCLYQQPQMLAAPRMFCRECESVIAVEAVWAGSSCGAFAAGISKDGVSQVRWGRRTSLLVVRFVAGVERTCRLVGCPWQYSTVHESPPTPGLVWHMSWW